MIGGKVAGGVVMVALMLPLAALAAELRAGEQPSLAANERIDGNLYIAGGSVSSAGTVSDDLIAAGGSVLVSGPVGKDAHVAGGNILILGTIGEDLRAAGGNIVVNAGVKGEVAAVGGQTTVMGSGIGGDLMWAGGTLRVDAPVAGNLRLAGGQVMIDSAIHGSVEFKGEKLTLGKSAVIDGALTYESPKEATLEDGAIVKGKTTYTPAPARSGGKALFAGVVTIAILIKMLAILACALVIGLIFKRYSSTIVEEVMAEPWTQLGRGTILIIVLPVASIVLLATIFGAPLGLLGLIAFAAVVVLGSIMAPIVLGSIVSAWIFKTEASSVTWKSILFGVLLYTVLSLLPFIGWLAKAVIFLLTIGAMLKIKRMIVQEWR
jgi:hypothetical protein